MEDDLIIFKNGKRPQFFFKWITTSIFSKMEDDHNLAKLEDDLFFKNGRRPPFFQKLKTTSIFSKTEDDTNFFEKKKTTSINWKMKTTNFKNNLENGRELQYFFRWKTRSISF